jgi:hypothetical protein
LVDAQMCSSVLSSDGATVANETRASFHEFSTRAFMSFRFSGQMSFEEYLEAHLRMAHFRRLWLRGIVLLGGVASIFYAVLFLEGDAHAIAVGAGISGPIYAFFVSPWQFRLRVRRLWDRYPRVQKQLDVEIDDDGIVVLDDRGAPSLTAWENIIGFDETKSLYLIYFSPLLPICLPKRLTEETRENGVFRDFVIRSMSNSRR